MRAGQVPIKAEAVSIPPELKAFFWDVDFRGLRWERDRDFIIGRILASGGLPELRWLRDRLGASALRQWLLERHGAGLAPRQIRFWEVVLGLPHRRVNGWLQDETRVVWDRRVLS